MEILWFAQKKLLCLILMACTAISVLGTFSFAVLEPYHAVESEIANKAQDNIFGSIENFFVPQLPAEEPVILAALGSARFSPLRMEFQRITALLGSLICGKPYSKSSTVASVQIHYSDIKNHIILKLRI
jgi:hypothetical protein